MNLQNTLINLVEELRPLSNDPELQLKIDGIIGVIKPGERVYHPVFGLGTLNNPGKGYWAYVTFDEKLMYGSYKRVAHHKLKSIRQLVNREAAKMTIHLNVKPS